MISEFTRNANIYCPDCDEMLLLTEDHHCYCEKCKKSFSEEEIRKKCGI